MPGKPHPRFLPRPPSLLSQKTQENIAENFEPIIAKFA